MVKNNLKKYISGFSLIEVIIGLGIITVVLTSIILSLQFFIKASLLNTEKVQASFLLEEGIEIPRFLRDDSWSNITGLTVDTSYYFTSKVVCGNLQQLQQQQIHLHALLHLKMYIGKIVMMT